MEIKTRDFKMNYIQVLNGEKKVYLIIRNGICIYIFYATNFLVKLIKVFRNRESVRGREREKRHRHRGTHTTSSHFVEVEVKINLCFM